MSTFVQPGDELELTAPSGGVTAGTPVKIGDLLVDPVVTALEGARFTGVRRGVVEVEKVPEEEWTEGQQVNWDDVSKVFTTVTTGNWRAGIALRATVNPSATGFVLLPGVGLGSPLE